jgi:hypothetical protein
MPTSALAKDPTEKDYEYCLSLVGKSQALITQIEEYGTFASRLWEYEPAKVAAVLEKYRFEASLGLSLLQLEDDALNTPKRLAILFVQNYEIGRSASLDYAQQFLAEIKSEEMPLRKLEDTVNAQLGKDIWKCESAVRKIRRRIEGKALLQSELEKRMAGAILKFDKSDRISVAPLTEKRDPQHRL